MSAGLADAWWSEVGDRAEEDAERMGAAHHLADSLCEQGKYAKAEQMQREVLEVKKRVLGPEHARTLTTAGNLALFLSYQGKHAEAEQMQREVLEVQKQVLGAEHARTLSVQDDQRSLQAAGADQQVWPNASG